MASDYSLNVFLNIPFDDHYEPLKNALIFAIFDCGFIPRCALEEDNSGNVRFDKIQRLIGESMYAVHDISRTELDAVNHLPRFNMPLELGVFVGAKTFGTKKHRVKNCLILDQERFRYQKFISDISGHDIRAHGGDEAGVIRSVRNWLNNASGNGPIPGARTVVGRYERFVVDLPEICDRLQFDVDDLPYRDYCTVVEIWLKENTTKAV